MKLYNLARLNQEFGNFQLPDRGGVRASLKMAEAYIDLEYQLNNLHLQKQILFHSLEFARDDINELEGSNIVLTLKVNAEQAINYTHWFIHALGFIGFGWVTVSLSMMVR